MEAAGRSSLWRVIAHVPFSGSEVRVNYLNTSAKSRIWGGFVHLLGGFFRIR
jgi:hypothetical protein